MVGRAIENGPWNPGKRSVTLSCHQNSSWIVLQLLTFSMLQVQLLKIWPHHKPAYASDLKWVLTKGKEKISKILFQFYFKEKLWILSLRNSLCMDHWWIPQISKLNSSHQEGFRASDWSKALIGSSFSLVRASHWFEPLIGQVDGPMGYWGWFTSLWLVRASDWSSGWANKVSRLKTILSEYSSHIL